MTQSFGQAGQAKLGTWLRLNWGSWVPQLMAPHPPTATLPTPPIIAATRGCWKEGHDIPVWSGVAHGGRHARIGRERPPPDIAAVNSACGNMVGSRRTIFFLNGTRPNMEIGKHRSVWGFPLHGRKWTDALAELQQAGFAAGAEVLGIVGPFACLRAVVGSARGVYWDDTAVWPPNRRNDVYPVRIELTRIQEINRPWYLHSQGEEFRAVLEDRYFTERSLYVLRPGTESHPKVDWQVVLGSAPLPVATLQPPESAPSSEVPDPQSLEELTADLFADIGFRVEQLGHKRPYERVPDGIAHLPMSLTEHLQRMNEKPYFIMWDCKFDSGVGLAAADERAVREYVTDFAKQSKLTSMVPEFWCLILARTRGVCSRIQTSLDRATWPDYLGQIGCRGLKAASLDWLQAVTAKAREHRRNGGDPDIFMCQEIPRMLKGLSSR